MDGSFIYNHDDDGISHQLAGCIADFRNRANPIKAKVNYSTSIEGGKLSVCMDLRGRGYYQRCLSVSYVRLPSQNYYMALSAQTSDSADSHSIKSVQLYGANLMDESQQKIQQQQEIAVEKKIESSASVADSNNNDDEEENPVEGIQSLDKIAHEKLDALIARQSNGVDSAILGKALDEIERNLVRQFNAHFSEISLALSTISSESKDAKDGLQSLRTLEMVKYQTTLQDLQRMIAELLTGGPRGKLGRDVALVMDKTVVEMKSIIKSEISSLEARLESQIAAAQLGGSSKGGNGFSFWVIVILAQVLFACVVVIRALEGRLRPHAKLP